MNKSQRYRYEMFGRVSGFGADHQDLFPEPSTAREWFKQVAAAVAAIDGYLKQRVLARTEARRVKAATRVAVYEYMKTIAHVARRIVRGESGENPFAMPGRRTIQAVLSTARAFVDEATKRQEQFVRYGLPPAAIGEFQALVDTLQRAAMTKQTSRTSRDEVQAAIQSTLEHGLEVIRDLDAAVAVATREDPVRLAAWRTARRIEGQGVPASRLAKGTSVPPPASTEPATVVVDPITEKAS